jgi:hypothetical protein
MDSERPPSSRVEALSGSTAANARGSLREALGAVRNLAQLLHSLRVAPKSLASVLPDVLEACTSMRTSIQMLLAAVAVSGSAEPARVALEAFFDPRIARLEEALRAAIGRALNAKTRLALEEIVSRSSLELDTARELLQLLEDAVGERSVRLDPRELVREAFSAPARGDARPLVSAVLSANRCGHELEIAPRVAMVLIAVGVELVGARGARETPFVIVSSDGRSACTIRIQRRESATGEPLVLARRGIVDPTLPCLRAAAALSRAELEWNPSTSEFSLSYPLSGAARTG